MVHRLIAALAAVSVILGLRLVKHSHLGCWPEYTAAHAAGLRYHCAEAQPAPWRGVNLMKAAVLHELGGPTSLRWEQVPDPVPAPGEVLVRVRAAAVNRTLDIELTEGAAGWQPPLPHIPGSEPAGEVVAVGEGVRDVRLGDRVTTVPAVHCGACRQCLLGYANSCLHSSGIGRDRPGGYAELVALPARGLIQIPNGLSFEQGAAIA